MEASASSMYDVVIIGGGPSGYTCAIKAAQLGGNVCLIEKNGLGGTCTQRGCIPTKFLHSMGDLVRKTTLATRYGINAKIELDYKLLKSKMEATVSRLASGIKLLLKSNGVEIIEGEGHIVSKNKVAVNQTVQDTRNIVIATGSYPVCLPNLSFGGDILSTTTLLQLDELPKSVTIIGAGYSGCELASIFNALGSKITLIEAKDHIIPNQIHEIGNALEKYMTLDGISVRTRSRVDKIVNSIVQVNGEKIESEKILVCIGRRPQINEQELDNIGVNFNEKGIIVDDKMRTSEENIYAIGDITGMYELAHVAARQGEVAAENIMGMKDSKMEYRYVPACIFTYPEVAFVGKMSGRSGVFPFTASAKANCLGDTRGLIKVYEREGILGGVYIIGSHAGEIIGEAALAINLKLRLADISSTIHPHPTLPESFVEAVKDIYGKSIDLPTKNKSKGQKHVH
jgi:dihydrolipoamide dehydrogenase